MSIKILKVEGEPRERGKQIGNELKEMINNSLDRIISLIEQTLGSKKTERLLRRLIKGTKLKEAVQKWTPSLWEEFEAIAESTGIDINTLFAFQCQDEVNVILNKFGIDLGSNCSTFSCAKTTSIPSIVAQTYDWPCFHNVDEIVILRVKYPDSSFETIIPTILGIRYLCGINNQSIGVCVNALCAHLNHSLNGLPVPYVTRGLVEQPTLEKAVDFLHSIDHASGYAYMIGDSENIMNYECSANKILRYLPSKDVKRIYHTNHPLVSDDLLPKPNTDEFTTTTYERYDLLDSKLKDLSTVIDIDTAKKILSTPPVCILQDTQPFNNYTIISVINELKKKPVLHLTLGPPCSNEFQELHFS